jgi:hypothetical protein
MIFTTSAVSAMGDSIKEAISRPKASQTRDVAPQRDRDARAQRRFQRIASGEKQKAATPMERSG